MDTGQTDLGTGVGWNFTFFLIQDMAMHSEREGEEEEDCSAFLTVFRNRINSQPGMNQTKLFT